MSKPLTSTSISAYKKTRARVNRPRLIQMRARLLRDLREILNQMNDSDPSWYPQRSNMATVVGQCHLCHRRKSSKFVLQLGQFGRIHGRMRGQDGVAVFDSRGRMAWVGGVVEDGSIELESDDTSVQGQSRARAMSADSAFVANRFEHMPKFLYGGFPCLRNSEERSSVLARHGFDNKKDQLVGVEDLGHCFRHGGCERSFRFGPPGR
jgi:hypothetical protein